MLVHCGVLAGTEATRASLGLPPAILTQALHRDDYLVVPVTGLDFLYQAM